MGQNMHVNELGGQEIGHGLNVTDRTHGQKQHHTSDIIIQRWTIKNQAVYQHTTKELADELGKLENGIWSP